MQATIAAYSEVMCGVSMLSRQAWLHKLIWERILKLSGAAMPRPPPGKFPSFVNRLRVDARILKPLTRA